MNERLLTRDEFRSQVFTRDNNICVFCTRPAADAHHILERRLWPDGGYYLSNGASVCPEHHIECEKTTISVEEVRDACGITKYTIPPHLYADQIYDKWGNPVQPSGARLRGELFDDPSVQKILKEGGVLDSFIAQVKYPRTHHVPWSPGLNDDDRVLSSMEQFHGIRVIVTEKMDGENTTMYPDYFHARSIDGTHHPSRDRVKAMWGQICGDIPAGWRICGENLYAKHSIAYEDLDSYFYAFSIWDETNHRLDYNQQQEWFQMLGLVSPKVLYDGIYDEAKIKALYNEKTDWDISEGWVITAAKRIHYSEFKKYTGKYVRSKHVQTSKHWMHGQRIVPNILRSE